jgi:hypothetical protein
MQGPHRAARLSGSRLPLPYQFSKPDSRMLRRNTDRSVLDLHLGFSPRSANARPGRRGESDRKSRLCQNGRTLSHTLVPYSAKIPASVHLGPPQRGFELQYSIANQPFPLSLPYSPAVDNPQPSTLGQPHRPWRSSSENPEDPVGLS